MKAIIVIGAIALIITMSLNFFGSGVTSVIIAGISAITCLVMAGWAGVKLDNSLKTK